MHVYKFTQEEFQLAIDCLSLYAYNIERLNIEYDVEPIYDVRMHLCRSYYDSEEASFTGEQLSLIMDAVTLGVNTVEWVVSDGAKHPVFALYQRLGGLFVGHYDANGEFVYDSQKISETT